MAKSTLLELKLELTPYVIKQELVDETDSRKIGNGAYGVISKVKYCGTPCAFKELHSFLLPAGVLLILATPVKNYLKWREIQLAIHPIVGG